jgi:hypothetical protein
MMNILPTLEEMITLFRTYNPAIWPMQMIAYLLALAAFFLVLKPTQKSSRYVLLILSFLWLWNGIVFCCIFWGPVSAPAYAFGVLLIIQGLLFGADIFRRKIFFRSKADVYSITGIVFLVYAAFVYPLIGSLVGHGYPSGPILGVAPCPTTIFTLGLLMMTRVKVPGYLLIIPLLWALMGFIPVSIGIVEDIGLIMAGIVCTAMILYRDKKAAGKTGQ